MKRRNLGLHALAVLIALGLSCNKSDPGNPGNPPPGDGTTFTPTLPSGVNYAFVGQLLDNSVNAFDVAIVPPAGATITTPIMTPVLTTGLPIDMAIEKTLVGTAASSRLYVADAQNKQLLVYDPAKCTPANVATASLGTIGLANAPIYTNSNPLLAIQVGLLAPVLQYVQYPVGVAVNNGKVYVPSLINTVVVTSGIPAKGLMDVDLTGSSSHNLLGLVDNFPIALGAFRACAAGQYVFVSNTLTNSVSIIDTAAAPPRPADEVVATVPVGLYPTGLAFDGVDTVWVCCTFDGTVVPVAINRGTFSVGPPVTAGVGPIDICKGTQTSATPLFTNMYVTNYYSGDISFFDPLSPPAPGVPAQTMAASGTPSLMNALGLSRAQMQQMLDQMSAQFGQGLLGNLSQSTSASNQLFNLPSIFNLLFGSTGSTSSAGVIPALLNQHLNSFRQQLGGTAGQLPVCGLWGVGFASFPNGTAGHDYRLVVANSVTGEVTVIDPVTLQPVGSVMPGGALFNMNGSGTVNFIPPGVASIEIFDSTP